MSCSRLPIIQDPSNDYYKMNHAKRGDGHIFNHINDGIDKNRIKRTLEKFKFTIHTYDHFTYAKIKETLTLISSRNYDNADCLVIVVITHGDVNILRASDYEYHPNILLKPFSNSNCPSLAGKPKLFLIDSCRGKILDYGQRVAFDGNTILSSTSIKIPKMADMLIMYSTQEGYFTTIINGNEYISGHYGYGDTNTGSWFIQSFCEEVEKRYESMEFVNILTLVNRHLALFFEGKGNNSKFSGTKQIGSIVSSLTRLLYFSDINSFI